MKLEVMKMTRPGMPNEDAEYEFNARYDDVRERYAGEIGDPGGEWHPEDEETP